MMATENEKLATEIAATASAIEKDAEELDWAHVTFSYLINILLFISLY